MTKIKIVTKVFWQSNLLSPAESCQSAMQESSRAAYICFIFIHALLISPLSSSNMEQPNRDQTVIWIAVHEAFHYSSPTMALLV